MIHTILIILYSLLSITGNLIYFRENFKDLQQRQSLSLLLFILIHTCFLIIGIACLFTAVHTLMLLAVEVLVIISRIINGQILYLKNNWRHYFVTVPLMTIIFFLPSNNL